MCAGDAEHNSLLAAATYLDLLLESLDPLDLELEPPDDFDLLPDPFDPLGEEERLLDGVLFAMFAAICSWCTQHFM
jgi:hypothetical protein